MRTLECYNCGQKISINEAIVPEYKYASEVLGQDNSTSMSTSDVAFYCPRCGNQLRAIVFAPNNFFDVDYTMSVGLRRKNNRGGADNGTT